MAENSKGTAKSQVRGRPFRPGQSGNPGGRPKTSPMLVEALRVAEPEAIRVLVDLMRSAKREQVRLQAAQAILDRLHGRPTQPLLDAHDSEHPLEIRVVYDNPHRHADGDAGGR